jgi:CubicO group peptidase (beta-lactamase class C family)
MLHKILANLVETYQPGTTTPGFSIRINKSKDRLLDMNVGARDQCQNPITDKSNFRVASVSKQFTAAAVLQLIEKGLLSLDTSLFDIFSDFPAYGKSIQIQHLLCHASGLKDYENFLEEFSTPQISDEQVVRLAYKQKETLFAPGSQYQYSNGAYCVLAAIIAKISKTSFENYLIDNIFLPAGMLNTRLNSSLDIPERAYGFARTDDRKWIPSDQNKTSATQGDGGIYSSVEDLTKWQFALYQSERILSTKYRELMVSPHIMASSNESYGCGLFITRNAGSLCYRHGGESIGFSNALFYFPEENISLVILSNINGIDMVEVGKSYALQTQTFADLSTP